MKRTDSSSESVLDKLLDCTMRGAQVELTLRSGQKISNFRVHEVIAPKGQGMAPDRREARARGVVWPDQGAQRDDYIQVRDIQSVREERLASYLASEDFFQRHPLPLGWVRLASCPTGPKKK